MHTMLDTQVHAHSRLRYIYDWFVANNIIVSETKSRIVMLATLVRG